MGIHLITGAGSGIGESVAHLLAERGEDLLLLARSEERATDLRSTFPEATTVVADLGSTELETALSDHGPAPAHLDSVIHAAGVAELDTVENIGTADFLDTLMVNLVAPTVLTGWVLPGLRAAKGSVIFVNSTSALVANPSWGAYAASKAGLKSIADSLRSEEAAHGVRVSTVMPSRTATPMQQDVRRQEGGTYDVAAYLDASTVAAAIVSVLDLPRDASIPEIVLRPSPRV